MIGEENNSNNENYIEEFTSTVTNNFKKGDKIKATNRYKVKKTS